MLQGDEKTSGVITFDYVVNSVFNQLNNYTQREYDRYLQFAIEGFGQLNLSNITTIRVEHLQMNDAKVVELPPDYIDYVKVAVCINGRLWTLSLNENMCVPRAEICGVPVRDIVVADPQNLTIPGDGYLFPDHYFNGRFIGGLYGIGGGFNIAYFKVDKERRQMIFSGTIPNDEVVLEYKSTGVSKNNTTLIPFQALAALKAYIHWQRVEYDPNVSMGEKQRKKDLYEEECNVLNTFERSFTVDEYLDMCYRSSKQSPKR